MPPCAEVTVRVAGKVVIAALVKLHWPVCGLSGTNCVGKPAPVMVTFAAIRSFDGLTVLIPAMVKFMVGGPQ